MLGNKKITRVAHLTGSVPSRPSKFLDLEVFLKAYIDFEIQNKICLYDNEIINNAY